MRPRWIALAAGLALIAVAFAAAGRVADTREGLIAEVVTLLGGLAGVCLVLLGLFAGTRTNRAPAEAAMPRVERAGPRPASELAMGGAGLLLAAFLVGGLGLSGGWLWAGLGGALLLPMIAGSAYLCLRFARTRPRKES